MFACVWLLLVAREGHQWRSVDHEEGRGYPRARLRGVGPERAWVRSPQASKDAVFVLKLRIEGRQRFITIGKHGAPWKVELARAKARSLLGRVVDGRDPASDGDERTKAMLVREVADLFLSEHVRSSGSPERQRRTSTS